MKNYRNQRLTNSRRLIKLLKNDHSLWNGKIYKDCIYLKTFGCIKINKKRFLNSLPNDLLETYRRVERMDRENFSLDQEFRRKVLA